MAHVKKIFLFKPVLEKTYLIILAFSFVLAAILGPIVGWHHKIGPYSWLEILVGYVMLNTVHTIFTILLLFFIPEVKSWFFEKIRSRKWLIQFSLVTIILILCSYFFAFDNSLKDHYVPGYEFFIVPGLLLSIHNLSQTKGISLLYNKLLLPTLAPAEILLHQKAERRERLLFNMFIWFQVVNFFLFYFPYIIFSTRIMFYYSGTITLSILIICNSFTFPQIKKTYKRFFLLGTIYLSAAAYSPIVLLIQRSLHGLEYTFLSYGMAKRSKIKFVLPTLAIIVSLFVLIISTSLLGLYRNMLSPFFTSKFLFIIIGFNFFIEYFHYYLDSQLFKFSDRTTQKYIQPLMPTHPYIQTDSAHEPLSACNKSPT